jgi:bifunctional polynucleotide phosphatase/kinase
VSPSDWKWLYPSIPTKLRTLSSQGYNLVILTNQGRLTTSTGAESAESELFKSKVDILAKELDVGFTIYVACANDRYRKPRTGMWDRICEDFGLRGQAGKDIEACLVGDAAGRANDHSDSDLHFCENLGISFFTPEEFFLSDKSQVVGHKFHPGWFLPAHLGGGLVSKLRENIDRL